MTEDERDRALQISLRLKAARFLAGNARVRPSSKTGKPEAIALPLEELALRPGLAENRITLNKLGEIEQMVTQVTPSQVQLIGRALGVDLEELPLLEPAPKATLDAADPLVQALQEGAQETGQRKGAQPRTSAAQDRRKRARGADA